ncbi:MAG: dihydroorotase [Bacteroidales bacterium]|jgi:dihydroorotase|nr:dihydroorotase [Bacteroidales bacterium]HOI31668.1 dihydroorotase [Bacteroidales bacterium]
MPATLIRNATLINEGKRFVADVLIRDAFIEKIAEPGVILENSNFTNIDAKGLLLIPGVIDDQVHFREPGLTYKADIQSESRAAIAGGITSYMEMPNTIPNVLTQELLEEKYQLAAQKSMANFSFYMGASNDNLDEIVKTDPKNVCGIKVFMGSSTGNMLVDDEHSLSKIFNNSPTLVAVHCEDETTIRQNLSAFRKKFPNGAPARVHPQIRSDKACYLSSSKAVELAKKYNTRLHILHLSTAIETSLFTNEIPLEEKQITAEVCLHHLWFSDKDYDQKGNFIKWNPAIKSEEDRQALWEALRSGKIDVIATDHAPHTFEEKSRPYFEAPSGGPMVQHLLPAMLDLAQKGYITTEMAIDKMCHNPAMLFKIQKRGFIREGYYADLVLVEPNQPQNVTSENIHYKCGWSPLEGTRLNHQVRYTFVNGAIAYENGKFNEEVRGQRLLFDR